MEQIGDDREEIELELDDEQFLAIAKMAHERDITFNKMIESIIRDGLERITDEN